jgi:hypothetical protein
MADTAHVNPTRLEVLDAELKQTRVALERLFEDNAQKIATTMERIDMVTEEYKQKKEIAYHNYTQAQDELSSAISRYSGNESRNVPNFYYEVVKETRQEYNHITDCCARIKEIKYTYETAVNQYKQHETAEFQNYSSILNKSSGILARCVELTKRSSAVIPGDTGDGKGMGFMSAAIPAALIGLSAAANTGAKTTAFAPSSNVQMEQMTQSASGKTKQQWTVNADGSSTFDSPQETGKKLDYNQGKVKGFNGTCGIVSSANVLRIAGKNATEEELVKYASTSSGPLEGHLCTTRTIPGGTTPETRQAILKQYGVESELQEATVDNIAQAVSEGKGVIISVYAGKLWGNARHKNNMHAITVTSVVKNSDGSIAGFWVTDSGAIAHEPATYYSKATIHNALTKSKMNVTSNTIW